MKYLPPIDLWDRAVNTALRNGQLKLQRGQWVKCGDEKCSRFVGMRGDTIIAAHPDGTGTTTERFRTLCTIV